MGGPIPNPFASKPSAPSPAPVAATVSAPTTSEVSQASATDASGIKRRRRGRSQSPKTRRIAFIILIVYFLIFSVHI